MLVPVELIMAEWPPNSGVMPGNSRFDALFADIKNNGILEPLTINLKWHIVDGNHRLAAAKLLDIKNVEVMVWTGTRLVA